MTAMILTDGSEVIIELLGMGVAQAADFIKNGV